jgi:outer membrane protein TolC
MAANANIGVRAAYFPDLTLSMNGGYQQQLPTGSSCPTASGR